MMTAPISRTGCSLPLAIVVSISSVTLAGRCSRCTVRQWCCCHLRLRDRAGDWRRRSSCRGWPVTSRHRLQRLLARPSASSAPELVSRGQDESGGREPTDDRSFGVEESRAPQGGCWLAPVEVTRRKVPQRQTAGRVRPVGKVKRCGKSAPAPPATRRLGKPTGARSRRGGRSVRRHPGRLHRWMVWAVRPRTEPRLRVDSPPPPPNVAS